MIELIGISPNDLQRRYHIQGQIYLLLFIISFIWLLIDGNWQFAVLAFIVTNYGFVLLSVVIFFPLNNLQGFILKFFSEKYPKGSLIASIWIQEIIIYILLLLWVIGLTCFTFIIKDSISLSFRQNYPYLIMNYVCLMVPIRRFILSGVLEIDTTQWWDKFTFKGFLHNSENANQIIYPMTICSFVASALLLLQLDISDFVDYLLGTKIIIFYLLIMIIYICSCTINKINKIKFKD